MYFNTETKTNKTNKKTDQEHFTGLRLDKTPTVIWLKLAKSLWIPVDRFIHPVCSLHSRCLQTLGTQTFQYKSTGVYQRSFWQVQEDWRQKALYSQRLWNINSFSGYFFIWGNFCFSFVFGYGNVCYIKLKQKKNKNYLR